MDRADWLRITAAFSLALVTSRSTLDDVHIMVISARDAWTRSTATDRVGVNLEPMNVDGMLKVPYVEGTVTRSAAGRRNSAMASGAAAEARRSAAVRATRRRDSTPSAPIYPQPYRPSKRITA